MSNSLKELNLNDHKNWIISDLILKQAKKFPKFNIIEYFETFFSRNNANTSIRNMINMYLLHMKLSSENLPVFR